MEAIEIGIDDIGSSGFSGSGIELLMNDKPRATNNDIAIGDLNTLENELNDLTGTSTNGGGMSDSFPTMAPMEEPEINIDPMQSMPAMEESTDSRLGSATANFVGQSSDLMKMPTERPAQRMSDREMRRKKRIMLKKLDDWNDKGLIKLQNNLTMETDFDEIEDEYETALEDKRRKDSVKLQGWWFMTAVNSLEYANSAFNPFDVNLDGWGEQVNEDIDSYEELFGELHEKYKGGKIAPELSLLLRLGFSAAVVNFTNKALSTSVPGFNDVMRQNPDLMKAFTDATVNTMSQNSPAFAMANDMMANTPKPTGPPPPAPQATQTTRSLRPESRPDISHAESGIELDTAGKVTQERSARPEMRGPKNSDIDDLLAGLKTKNVNIQNKKSDSVVSAASVADMTDAKVPKRTQKRKQKSDRSIALDI